MPIIRGSAESVPKSPPTDRDGNSIQNEILLRVPEVESDLLLPHLEFVRFKPHQVLHEAGQSISSVYFLNSGLASILNVTSDGRSVEVGLIGREGFVGLAAIAGFRTSSARVIAQTNVSAFRLDAHALPRLLPRCPEVNCQVLRFWQIYAVQVEQISACNRLHRVNQRFARWLLMAQDRIGSKALPLTQDLLAQMLGTRRSSVTVAAGRLQRTGSISYTRGSVTILKRQAIEKAACECYALIRQHLDEKIG